MLLPLSVTVDKVGRITQVVGKPDLENRRAAIPVQMEAMVGMVNRRDLFFITFSYPSSTSQFAGHVLKKLFEIR